MSRSPFLAGVSVCVLLFPLPHFDIYSGLLPVGICRVAVAWSLPEEEHVRSTTNDALGGLVVRPQELMQTPLSIFPLVYLYRQCGIVSPHKSLDIPKGFGTVRGDSVMSNRKRGKVFFGILAC
ncbi:hypothetical protein NDU88_001358 [Pleurodeles waltl]|uniref:Secreted protein n=1 Tax=Pleurodeles waltl TaxID=8319 RepID=A0AAV7TI28_PLEWA|nr:hypothetical protein NDU88_001358 [Pleurodeles waltl]